VRCSANASIAAWAIEALALQREVAAWVAARNGAIARIDWRCTTADARIKLKRRYPVIQA